MSELKPIVIPAALDLAGLPPQAGPTPHQGAEPRGVALAQAPRGGKKVRTGKGALGKAALAKSHQAAEAAATDPSQVARVRLAEAEQTRSDAARGGKGAGIDAAGHGQSHLLPYLLGGIAVAGGVAALAGGGGSTPSTPAGPKPVPTPSLALTADTGASNTDGITRNGTITVSGLQSGAKWEYSTDNGASWKAGSGTSFDLPEGVYPAGAVQVRQTDSAGTVSAAGKLATGLTVDTTVATPTMDPVAGDNVLTLAEATSTAGVTVHGTAEAKATVDLVWRLADGTTIAKATVTADADGKWSYTFSGKDLPDAHTPVQTTLTATATDPAGNVSTPLSRAIVTDPGVTVQGAITAGAVTAGNDLAVNLYDGTGKLLASGIKVNADGTFRVDNVPLVKGDVVIATLVNGTQPDYIDETTGLPTNVSASLMAALTIGSASATLNINPLTTLAALAAGLAASAAGGLSGTVSSSAIQSASQAVAKAFGLGTNDLSGLTPEVIPAGGWPAGTPLTPAQQAGLVLAALSGLDGQNGGNAQQTIDALAKALADGGGAGLSDSGLAALLGGAQAASGKLGTALLSLLSAQLAAVTGSGAVAIDRVAGDDVINAAEGAGLTLTGAVTEGATSVSLKFAGRTVEALVVGGTWSYTLSADDLAALGGDGAVVLQATATLADGSTASALRAVLHEASGPGAPHIDPVLVNDQVGIAAAANGVVVSGTAEAWATVKVDWGGTSHTVTADASGKWQVRFGPSEIPTGEGAAPVTASVVDRFGNPGQASTTHPVTLDYTAPGAPVINPVGKFGMVSPAAIKAGLSLSGTGEVGATVTVSWDKDHVQSTTVGSDGKWQVRFTADQLPADMVSFTATQTDPAGNVGKPATLAPLHLVRSENGPVLGSIADGNGVSLAEAAKGVTVFGVGAPGSKLTIDWQGADSKTATVDSNGYWSVTYALSDLPVDGTARLTVSGTDAGGTPLAPASVDVVIDTAPPAAATIDPVAGDGRVNLAEKTAGVKVSGKAQEAGTQAWVTWGGKTHKVDVDPTTLTWTTTFAKDEIPADAAKSTIAVSIVDGVGNASQAIAVDVQILTAPPAAPTLSLLKDTGSEANGGSASDGKSNDGRVVVGGLVAGGKWEYTTDGGENWLQGQGSQFKLSDETYPAGSVLVRQTDAAGNISQIGTVGPLIIKTSAPSISLEDVAGDRVVNAAERAHGVDIVFSLDNMVDGVPAIVTLTWVTKPAGGGAAVPIGKTVTVVVSGSGQQVVHFDASDIPDADVATTVLVKVTDAVGNVGQNASQDVAIKTSLPSAPTIQLSSDTGISAADGITSDTGILVGALTKGLSWEYSTDGKTWTEGDGNRFDLRDGTYAAGQILVRQVDGAGNRSAATAYNAPLTVDTSTVEPTIDAIGTNGVINAVARAQGVTITGTAELGARITFTINGKVYTADGNPSLVAAKDLGNGLGQWSIFLANDQLPADGTNWEAKATATDVAGNSSASSGVSRSFAVDTALPASPAVDPLIHSQAITAAERAQGLSFTGKTDPGTKVFVTFNGIEREATVTGTTWRVDYAPGEIPADTAPGTTASLTARAVTANANVSPNYTAALVIDSTTPAPTITPLSDGLAGSQARSQGLSFSGTAEANAVVTLVLGGKSVSTTADASGKWLASFATWQVPDDGAQTLTATATDRYGNVSSQQSYGFTLDTAAPTRLSITAVGNGNFVKAGDIATISGKATAFAYVYVTWDGVSFAKVQANAGGDWSLKVATSGAEATDRLVKLQAYVADDAGNVGPSLTREVPLLGTSHTGPTIGPVTGDDLINAAELAKGFRINGYAAPGSQVVIDGLGITGRKVDADSTSGLWTTSVAGQLADGDYTVTLTQNGQTVTRKITIDTKAPDAPEILDVTAANAGTHQADLVLSAAEKASDQIQVRGKTEHNSTVQVIWNGVEKMVTADDNGNWVASFKASEVPGSGTSTIKAIATDAAGNVGQASETSVTVNTGLTATDANHTVVGNGNGDELSGTAGADTFVLPDLTFRSINGGAGIDVVKLGAGIKGSTLDLARLAPGQLTNIEGIDISGGGSNHLIVDAAAILADTGGTNSLVVTGTAGERVSAFGFASTGTTLDQGGQHYLGYSNGSATLWVDQRIDQVVL